MQLSNSLEKAMERRLYRLPHPTMLGKNVLIIDPEPYFADSLAQKLHYFHCDVTICPDTATVVFQNNHYDLVMVDITQLDTLTKIIPPTMNDTQFIVLENNERYSPSSSDFPHPIEATLSKPCSQQMLFELFLKLYFEGYHENRLEDKYNIQILKGSRILLAEDDSSTKKFISDLLKHTGIELTIVPNGVEVLKVLEERPFDLLLMNIHMPLLGGYKTARALRKQPMLDSLPIIALTSDASQTDIDAIKISGMQTHLKKPFNADDFYAALIYYLKPTDSEES